ncbi:MAG: DUF3426 domain-containing protein [Oryzomonas sp.]|jgi:predicted Zn finger-like uncharacterized protein
MIIQCEQCLTKFRLDDAKIKAKGVKVRCAKCRHVFTVTKQQQEMESQPGDVIGFEQPPASPFAVPGADGESPFAPPAEESPSAPLGGEEPGFSFSDDAGNSAAGDAEDAAPSSEVDFSDFDFGDAAPEKGSVTAPIAADFGDESLFGDAVATPTPEESAGPITFDFPVEAFADSMGTAEKGWSGNGTVDGNDGAKADEPFSLGEIDFGDELTSVAVQQVNPEELKPAQELLFAPLAEAQGTKESAPQEELPPLSIASRRKQSPLFIGLVIVLVVAVVAVLGYFGYSMFSAEKVAKESGRISIRGVNAAFVKNSVAGELVVISGEAVNDFAGSRAAIQVKGMIYGPNGQVLASKNAFCGNPLTREQLATMPLDKIEAAMANQFGDSLDNLGVQPGKAIPFVIVIANPPASAKDFGVEPVGSTVATGKQP